MLICRGTSHDKINPFIFLSLPEIVAQKQFFTTEKASLGPDTISNKQKRSNNICKAAKLWARRLSSSPCTCSWSWFLVKRLRNGTKETPKIGLQRNIFQRIVTRKYSSVSWHSAANLTCTKNLLQNPRRWKLWKELNLNQFTSYQKLLRWQFLYFSFIFSVI